MTIPKTNPPRPLDALKMKVGVRVPGATGINAAGYRLLTGASVLDLPSGTRPVSQIPTFDGTATIAAAKSNENITFNLGVWQPGLAVHQDLARADANRLTVAGRMDIYAEIILAHGALGQTKAEKGVGITAVLDAADESEKAKGSKLTGPGLDDVKEYARSDQLLVGDIIRIAAAEVLTTTAGLAAARAASYRVNFVEHDERTGEIEDIYVTNMDGTNVAANVDNEVISLWEAGWRQAFSGKVNELRSHAADASGSPQLSSVVSFTPQGKLPPEETLYVTLPDSDWLKAA